MADSLGAKPITVRITESCSLVPPEQTVVWLNARSSHEVVPAPEQPKTLLLHIYNLQESIILADVLKSCLFPISRMRA